MLAKFEKRAYVGSEKVWVGKYRNLQNISHWHMEHEMIVCMEGCAQVMVADTIYTLLPKSVIFCQSGCVHYIHTDPDCLLLVCLFDEKLCEPLTHPYQLSTPLFQDHYNVLERLTAIRQELSEQPRFFEVRTIAMIEELMTDIFRSEPPYRKRSAAKRSHRPLQTSSGPHRPRILQHYLLRCRPVYECFGILLFPLLQTPGGHDLFAISECCAD